VINFITHLNTKSYLRWILIIASFAIISLILWNTYSFFQYFKAEEVSKMKSWTFAYTELSEELANDNVDLNSFEPNPVAEHFVIDETLNTPMILIDSKNNIVSHRNIFGKGHLKGKDKFSTTLNRKIDSAFVHSNKNRLIQKLSKENKPLIIENVGQILYYGNTPLLNKLKYYPLALILIIVLFGAVVFFFYRSSKVAAQNKLWSGMAKETAHQIGTPLSSLIGWAELLRTENVNPDYILEIEKDIDRLLIITERFSKVGSVPTLEKSDIVTETIASYDYLKARFSNLIDFKINTPEPPVYANLNRQLFSWTIENLVKNAIDAMKGKGTLTLDISQVKDEVHISISDTGKGLEKNKFKKIFEPGYTSKKRGWGLGLSLAKRIVEDYHQGKIKVLNSEIEKGTTMQLSLKIIS